MRGTNGESKDVPCTPSMVVVFAAIPPGVPLNEICDDPEPLEQLPSVLIEIAALPPPARATGDVPQTVPSALRTVTTAVVAVSMLLLSSMNA